VYILNPAAVLLVLDRKQYILWNAVAYEREASWLVLFTFTMHNYYDLFCC